MASTVLLCVACWLVAAAAEAGPTRWGWVGGYPCVVRKRIAVTGVYAAATQLLPSSCSGLTTRSLASRHDVPSTRRAGTHNTACEACIGLVRRRAGWRCGANAGSCRRGRRRASGSIGHDDSCGDGDVNDNDDGEASDHGAGVHGGAPRPYVVVSPSDIARVQQP